MEYLICTKVSPGISSYPYQPRPPLLSTPCLHCSLLPWQPYGQASLSLSRIHRDFCSCPQAAEDGLTKVVQRKRYTLVLVVSPQWDTCMTTNMKIAPLKLNKALLYCTWCWKMHCIYCIYSENWNVKVKCCEGSTPLSFRSKRCNLFQLKGSGEQKYNDVLSFWE